MNRYAKTYILQVVAEALAPLPEVQELNVPAEPPLESPGAPAVAPPDQPVFPEEIMRALERYKGILE